MSIRWQQLKGDFIDGSDALRVSGRPTTGLMGFKRARPRADHIALGDTLEITVAPDGDGYLLLLAEVEPLGRTVCLVPRHPGDTRPLRAGHGLTFPEAADQIIILDEPQGVHTIYAAVTDEPLPAALRARLCDQLAGRNSDDLLDALAAALAAMPGKELHRRSVVVTAAAAAGD